MTAITYPDTTENVTLTYDAISRLTKATRNAQDVTFAYNNRDRVTTTTDVFGQITASVYDAAMNRTQMKLNAVRQATHTFDIANRLTRITDEVSGIYNFTYDNADRRLSMTRPNTVKETLTYDGMSRLTSLKEAKGTTVLRDDRYSYNPANQISQIVDPSVTRLSDMTMLTV